MTCPSPALVLAAPLLFLLAPPAPVPGTEPATTPQAVFEHGAESVPDYRVWTDTRLPVAEPAPTLERISAGVPWPRGLEFVEGEVYVLARGRHRRAGGVDPNIADRSGALFVLDPDLAEPVVHGRRASPEVATNARLVAAPTAPPFQLYDGSAGPPVSDTLMDRPYCTLVWDAASKNFFVCGYSGVDLPGGVFRKNATDSIHRFDRRDGAWHTVELHDAAVVPEKELTRVVPNEYYPHHDPTRNAAPHGLLNGPDGATVVGRYLYAVGKDNHTLAQYDLTEIRERPDAGAPEGRVLLGDRVDVKLRGGVRELQFLGHSALAAHDGWLYVGFRTSSAVVRFPLEADGDLRQPIVGELIAVFQPWDPAVGKSANLMDLAFDPTGELFVACARGGRVWRVGRPDPVHVFDGIDGEDPWVDLVELTGNPSAGVGNITFDDAGRLLFCSGNYDSDSQMAGVIYRATPNPE